jgi:hypothetical protein
MNCSFTACYVSTVPGQRPEAFSGLGQSWSEVMRQETEEARWDIDRSALRVEQGAHAAPPSILAT